MHNCSSLSDYAEGSEGSFIWRHVSFRFYDVTAVEKTNFFRSGLQDDSDRCSFLFLFGVLLKNTEEVVESVVLQYIVYEHGRFLSISCKSANEKRSRQPFCVDVDCRTPRPA